MSILSAIDPAMAEMHRKAQAEAKARLLARKAKGLGITVEELSEQINQAQKLERLKKTLLEIAAMRQKGIRR